jgi:hypothetical protein
MGYVIFWSVEENMIECYKDKHSGFTSKELGLEINAEKNVGNYMFMPRQQNAGEDKSTELLDPMKMWRNSNA